MLTKFISLLLGTHPDAVIPTLPADIIDIILRLLYQSDDLQSLATCSLASKEFRALSSRYLFRTVFARANRRHRRNVDAFIHWLNQASEENVLPFIHEVVINGEELQPWTEAPTDEVYPLIIRHPICWHILSTILSKLPNLQRVSLDTVCFAHHSSHPSSLSTLQDWILSVLSPHLPADAAPDHEDTCSGYTSAEPPKCVYRLKELRLLRIDVGQVSVGDEAIDQTEDGWREEMRELGRVLSMFSIVDELVDPDGIVQHAIGAFHGSLAICRVSARL